MTAEKRLSARKRRTRAEVRKLVAEFMSSDMRRSEFCRTRGLSFSTLDRHLKKQRWKKRRTQQGLPVRARALEEAHPLLGASRIRAKY